MLFVKIVTTNSELRGTPSNYLSYLASICELRDLGFNVKVVDNKSFMIDNVEFFLSPLYYLAGITRNNNTNVSTYNGKPLLTFEYKGNKTSFIVFEHGIGIPEIYEVFIDETYGVFDYSGKTVIDIGGFIGDTSIYFVLNGAKKVFTYEPSPITFELLNKNIKLNKLENVIKTSNVGVNDSDGILTFQFSESNPNASGQIADVLNIKTTNVEVKVVDIVSVIDDIGELTLLNSTVKVVNIQS